MEVYYYNEYQTNFKLQNYTQKGTRRGIYNNCSFSSLMCNIWKINRRSIEMAKEAITLYIESLKKHKEDIPTDDSIFEYNLKVGINA